MQKLARDQTPPQPVETPTMLKPEPDWAEHIATAVALFSDKRYSDCRNILRKLLGHPDLPRLMGIRCHVFLATSVSDWYEAEAQRVMAENLWGYYASFWDDNPQDPDLKDVRELLDGVAERMRKRMPADYNEYEIACRCTRSSLPRRAATTEQDVDIDYQEMDVDTGAEMENGDSSANKEISDISIAVQTSENKKDVPSPCDSLMGDTQSLYRPSTPQSVKAETSDLMQETTNPDYSYVDIEDVSQHEPFHIRPAKEDDVLGAGCDSQVYPTSHLKAIRHSLNPAAFIENPATDLISKYAVTPKELADRPWYAFAAQDHTFRKLNGERVANWTDAGGIRDMRGILL